MVALIDQTTLAVSLPVIASALHASAQASWIANGYFVSVDAKQYFIDGTFVADYFQRHPGHLRVSNCCMVDSLIFGHGK